MSLLEKVFLSFLPLLQVSGIGGSLNIWTFSSVLKHKNNGVQNV